MKLSALMMAATLIAGGTTVMARPMSAGTSSNPTTTSPTKAPLQKGMTGDAIIAQIGRPEEVRTVPNPNAKAEIWTYRRLLDERTTQESPTVDMVPMFRGVNGDGSANIGPVPELSYRLVHVRVYQVTSLLMIDGKLALGRQRKEETRAFD